MGQYTILYNDGNSNPLPTDDVSVCQSETFNNTIRVVVSSNAADNTSFTLQMPPGMYYVPGCISVVNTNAGITIAEANLSDLTMPVFNVSPADLSAGDAFTFEFCRVADCAATAHQMGGGTFKDAIEVCGDNGCVSENDPNLNSYDLLTPSVSMVGEGPITAQVGDNVCREVTFTNGGQGYLDSLKYYILDGAGTATTSVVTVPGGTVITPVMNGDSLCYWLDASIFAEFGDGDNFFENGEQIVLERCYDVLSCDNDSYFGGYWGCPTVCMSTTEIQQQTNTPNLTPNLSFGFETGVNRDFCFKGQSAAIGGTAVMQTFEMCNTGSGPATNVTFELYNATPGSGTGQNYFTLDPGQIFDDSGASLGTTSSQTAIANNTYSMADCSRVVFPTSVAYEMEGIVIQPGECITIEIPSYANNLTQECDAQCNADIAWFYFNRSYEYQDACEINNYGRARAGIAYGGRQLYRYDIDMPTDMRDCDEFTLEVNYSNFYNNTKSTTEGSTELKVDVSGTGLLYTGTGTEVFKGVNVAVSQVGDLICVTYPHNGISNGSGILSLPLKATCAEGGGTKTVRLWHEGQYDDNCPGSKYHLKCLTRTYVMHCPEPCPEGGATPQFFSLERTSLGLEDLDNNGVPDGTGRAKPEDVELHRASNCDTVKGTWEIYVFPNTVGPNAGVPFNNLYVEFDLFDLNLDCTYFETDNLFEPLPDAEATIFPADGSPSYTCLVSPTIENTSSGTNDLAKYDLSACKAAWEDGDSIVFCANYVVTTSYHSSSFNQYVADNEVYSSYTADPVGENPSPENKYTCDKYNDFMNVYRHYFSPWTPTPQTINGCQGQLIYYLRYYINTQTGDIWYPNEYRPFAIPDKFTIQLDEALAYRPGSVTFSGNPVPDSDITQIGNTLTVCNLKQFFMSYGGPLLEPDESWNYNVRFNLDPTCEAQPGIYSTRFNGQVIGNGCHSPDMNYTAVTNCSNTTGWSGFGQVLYDGPQPFLTGGGTIQYTTSQGCWDVILNNGSNNLDAPFSWFYIDGGTNQMVFDAAGNPVAQDANGFYQLGDNNASASTNYTVCAQSSECDTTRINVLSGFGCTAYPTDINALSCSDTVQLVGLPLMSEVQLAFESQPSTPMPLCETQSFELKQTSAQAAYLDDPQLSILAPPGATISNIQVEYPCGSGNFEPASTTVNGDLILINLEAHSAMSANGMPGTIDALDPTEREACITFDLDTDCDFISSAGLIFQAFGKRPCGDPAINNGIRVRSSDLTIQGVNQPHGASVSIQSEFMELRGCDEGNNVEVNIDFVSLGSNFTSPTDSVIVTLDPVVEFVPGTFMCCSANPDHCLTLSYSETDANGYTRLVLAFPSMPVDLSTNPNMCFDFDVINAPGNLCDQPGNINVQVRASAGSVTCPTAAGGTCPNVQTVTGQRDINFTTEKIELSIDGMEMFGCTSTGAITYEVPVKLDSMDLEDGEFLVVDIFCATASGTPGNYIQSELLNGPITAGTTTLVSGTVAEGLCNPEFGIIVQMSSPNNDGIEQCICETLVAESGSIDCPANLTHEKVFTSLTETAPGAYDAKWTITVENNGIGDGTYNLNDVPGFDDDVEICGVEYTSDAPGNPGNPGPLMIPSDGFYELAEDQMIEGGATHTYCLIVKVKYDPSADPAVGDGMYTSCETASIGDPSSGEGLYNESQLDTDDDGTPDEISEVCEDLPCALDIISAVPSACDPMTGTYDVVVTVNYGAQPDCLLDLGGQTFLVDGSGSEVFTIENLMADGMTGITLSGFFTCEATCFDQIMYDAPEACSELICSTTQVDILCNGEATGSATVTASGGIMPYTYSWNSTPAQTTATATGLTAGDYSVTVTDNSGATTVCDVTLTQPSALTCSVLKESDISCNGEVDGSATVTPGGGTGVYTILWSSGESNATAVNLGAGSNSVTVTDDNGCTVECTIDIVEPAVLACSVDAFTNPLCAGEDSGTITVSATGGTGTITYSLNGGAAQTSGVFTDVPAGSHVITVSDANGCMAICNQDLVDPAALTCTVTEDQTASCGMNNGQATVTAMGGSPAYTYLWDNSETTATATSLVAGSHSVTVTDNNGCETVCLININTTTGLSCEITSSVDVSCNGTNDGAASVAATGGMTPFTYSWSNGASTASISGLSGGSYSVTVTDADNCSVVCSVEIAEATALVCDLNKDQDISCNGLSDGAATVAASGGVPGYTYEWSTGELTASATMLVAGMNSVTVTDADGCTTICNVDIIEPAAVTCSVDAFTNPLCAGESTGTLTVSASGGTGVLSFSLNGGAPQASGAFTNVPAGNHEIVVTDENGCSTSCTQTLTDPAVFTCSVVEDQSASCDMNDGEATVTPAGGTPGYTYLWDNTETTATATMLTAGSHSVTVTDANGCTTSCLVNINTTTGLSCEITSSTDVSCNGAGDGEVTVAGSGGTMPFTYTWSNGGNTATISNLSGGNYTVTVTDAAGCTSVCSSEVAEATELICDLTKGQDISCNGLTDGGASVTASGGVPGYTYAWSNGETTAAATMLVSGTNTVTVTDADGCTTTCEVDIIEPAAVTCSVDDFSNPLCAGESTGTITVSAMGGTGALTYSLDGGAAQSSGVFSSVAAGAHTIVVTDENGCTTSCSQTLTDPQNLTCTAIEIQSASCDMSDGQASVTGMGGTGIYTYLWDNTETTATATALSAGSHSVTVTDANGCETVCLVNINTTTGLACEITSSTDVSCNGAADGEVTVLASGGTMPFTYTWSNGADTPTISDLSGGTYTVTITDAAGCTSVCSSEVAEATALICDLTKDQDITCNGLTDGGASVSASGGTPGYTYAWSSGETTAAATMLVAGMNGVTVTDADGCTTECTVEIIEPAVITCSIDDFTNPLCAGESTGTITVSAAGGTGALTYSLDGGAAQSSGVFSSVAAGAHTIVVTDENGCTTSCSQTLTDPQNLTCTAIEIQSASCDMSDGQASVTGMGGTGMYTYLWDNTETTATAIALSAGSHSVTVTDANGCTTSCLVNISTTTGLTCEITSSTNVSCFGAGDGAVTVEAMGGTLPLIYAWSNGGDMPTISNLSGGTYTVTITDAAGCSVICSSDVTEATELICDLTKDQDISCNGLSDGGATVTASGGVPGYTYEWSTGETTASATMLVAGMNAVTVTDADGCTTECTVEIVDPSVVTCMVDDFTNPLCAAEASGTITVSASGGTGALTYSLDGGAAQPSGVFTNVLAGPHTIVVTDANGCTTSCSQSLTDPEALSCSVVEDQMASCDMSDGQATVTVMGGTAVYTYLWDNTETTATALALNAGSHSVTVTDANGCTTSCLININSIAGLTCEITSSSDVSCNGAADGTVTVSTMGGTMPITFEWSNGATTASLTDLSGGMYSVTATDAAGCTSICSVELNEATALICDVVKEQDISCNGLTDGSATVTASGGTPGYSYAWSNGETTPVAIMLVEGLNDVTVTDADGCTTVCEIEILEPEILTCDLSMNPSGCQGQDDGQITVTVMGGTAPFMYSLNGGTGQDGNVFNGLAPGNYDVIVTDANGCMSAACSIEVTVTGCLYDLSLIKELAPGETGVYNPNDDVTFRITVCNQAQIEADDITITDYIPSGMTFNAGHPTNTANGWMMTAAGYETSFSSAGGQLPAEGLTAGECVFAEIVLTVDADAPQGMNISNFAEISGDNGDDQDSTPDDDNTNDGPVTDNETDGANDDQDDHDVETIVINNFDLALTKVLATSQSANVAPGSDVTFTITVYNQGTIAADNIVVTDYVPACMTNVDPDWSGDDAGPVMTTLSVANGGLPAGGLAPDDIVQVDITLNVSATADSDCDLTNWAEISAATDDDGTVLTDTDSTPNDDPTDDVFGGDNETENLNGDEDDHDQETIGLLSYDLALTKSLATGQSSAVAPSDLIDYEITVTNQGEFNAFVVEITDYIPTCMTLADANWSGPAEGPATFTLDETNLIPAGGLTPGSSVTVPITLQLSNPVDPSCDLTNVAEISNDDGEDTDSDPDGNATNDTPGEDDIDEVEVSLLEFDLALTKSLAVGQSTTVMVGDDVTYTFTVTNQGEIPADNIEILDHIPADFALNDPDWTNTNPASITLSVANGDLPAGGLLPGAQATVDITLQVLMTAVEGNSYMNTGEINDATDEEGNPQKDRDSDPDSNPNNDPQGEDDIDEQVVSIMGNCDLALQKECAGFASNGDGTGGQMTFDIIIINQGNCDVYDIGVIDYIMQHPSWDLNDSDWYRDPFSGFAYYFIDGPLAGGESDTIQITFDITSFDINNLPSNYAEIYTASDFNGDEIDDMDSNMDFNPSNDGPPRDNVIDNSFGDEDDHDLAQICIPDLSIEKSLDPSMSPPYTFGDDIIFNICITNEGNTSFSSVEVADYIPAGFNFDPADNLEWIGAAPSVTHTFAGPINPGDQQCVDIVLEFVSGGMSTADYTNVTEITTTFDEEGEPLVDDWDSTPSNDDGDQSEDDEDNEVFRVFDIALTKVASTAGPYSYGQEMTFDYVIVNQGSVPAHDVSLVDYLPCGFEFVASPGWSVDPASGNLVNTFAGPVMPGSTATVPLTVNIVPCDEAGAWTNAGEITEAYDELGMIANDIDSDPDNDETNDGTPIDNNIDNSDGDEDDHDIEMIEIYDLALQKIIDNRGPYLPGDVVEFEIVLHNQGNVDANNILVTDYLNEGFIFTPGGVNDGWTLNGTYAEYTFAGPLAPGTSETITLFLEITIPANATFESWTNEAEIVSSDGTDADSTPDNDPNNDNDVTPGDDNDDEINEHGNGDDEDDNDVSDVLVTGSIGDTVWKDTDGDGLQNNGEVGVAGVVVTLFDCNGAEITTTTTDANGFYVFDLLLPGDYQLAFDISGLPQGCDFTLPNQGDETIDSDVDLNGDTECITLEAGEMIMDVDAGLIPLAKLGDFVFEDCNGDGLQTGESGVSGIEVELYNSEDLLVGNAFTDASGFYQFDNLYPGHYYVKVDPADYELAFENVGNNESQDSDIDHTNGFGTTRLVHLGPGECELDSFDIGLYKCVNIGERIWLDYNKNDLFDNTENGINGMKIELYRQESGEYILYDYTYSGHKPNTPSDDGYFKFCVPPGNYYLKFNNPPESLVPAVANFGINENIDSDVTGAFGDGTTAAFTVNCGQERCDIGAGYYTQGTIGDYVWLDSNGNGTRESNESGVSGIVVRAIDLFGKQLGMATTNSSGIYHIDNLGKNTYSLKFDIPSHFAATTPHMGNDITKDSDVDGTNGPNTTKFFTVNPGDYIQHMGAGLVSTGSIRPIEVDGAVSANANTLTWENNDASTSHFEIMRAVPGEEFEAIGKVLANYDTDQNNYKFEDFDIEECEACAYKVLRLDIDGEVTTSNNVSLRRRQLSNVKVSLYPNPVVDELTVELDSENTIGELKVHVLNAQGQTVKSNLILDVNVNPGQKAYKLDVKDLDNGIYTLKVIVDESKVINKKVIIID